MFVRLLLLFGLCGLCQASPEVTTYTMYRCETATDQSLMNMLRGHLQMSRAHLTSQKRQAYWQQYYLNDSYHLRRVLHNMAPFIPLMLKGIETYKLPGEIALIPVIECCYRTTDISDKGAQGLWQINSITAEHLKLQDNWDYQACFDVAEATQAAMRYLADLHERFGSWPLALAAYNMGPQALQKSLRYQNIKAPRDIESLPLPEQTKDFVAKIQALAQILLHYEHYEVVVPSQADLLVPLPIKLPLDARDFILAFDVPLDKIMQYNPALSHYRTPRSQRYQWLIPSSYLKQLSAAECEKKLYRHHKHPYYCVKKGDNLTKIARKFGLKAADLMKSNQLQKSLISPGQLLWIPPLSQYLAPVTEHEVQPGDSLWSIARKYGTTWEDLQRVNELPTPTIQPKQVLLIPAQIVKKFPATA